MQLLRGNANFRAEAEFAAVGKARGSIYVHRRRIDPRGKAFRRRIIAGYDGFAVVRGIPIDVRDGLIDSAHHLHSENVIQKFLRVILLRSGFGFGQKFACALIAAQLYVFLFELI